MNRRVVAYTDDNGGEEPRGSDARSLALCPNPAQPIGHVPGPHNSDVADLRRLNLSHTRVVPDNGGDSDGNDGGGGEVYRQQLQRMRSVMPHRGFLQ